MAGVHMDNMCMATNQSQNAKAHKTSCLGGALVVVDCRHAIAPPLIRSSFGIHCEGISVPDEAYANIMLEDEDESGWLRMKVVRRFRRLPLSGA
ncbi:hypothetical protein LguiB_000671 [Lonicera macranthoides]